MRPSLGALTLAAGLTLNPGEVCAQEASRYGDQIDLTHLADAELQRIRFVVENPMLQERPTPDHLAALERKDYEYFMGSSIYKDTGPAFYVYNQVYGFRLNNGNEVVLEPIENRETGCIAATTYIDQFNDNKQFYFVLSPDRVRSVDCPSVQTVFKVDAAFDESNLPETGNFANVVPSVIEESAFLVPMSLGLDAKQAKKWENDQHFLHTGPRGVDVYKKYDFSDYNPEAGQLTVQRPEGKDETDCLKTVSYEKTFKDGEQRYFVLPNTYSVPAECKVEAPVATGAPAAPLTEESRTHAIQVEAFLAGGIDAEEPISPPEYSLGYAPILMGAATVRPFEAPLSFGVMADAIFSAEGSGIEGVNGMVGYQNDRLGIYGLGGVAYEPRRPNTILDGAATGGVFVSYQILDRGDFGVKCAAGVELFFNPYLVCGGTFGRSFNMAMNVAKEKERTPEEEETVPAETVEPQKLSRLRITEIPYEPEVLKERWKPLDDMLSAEKTRIEAEMRKMASRNLWEAVEKLFNRSIELKIEPTAEMYMWAAHAARDAGNAELVYERLRMAYGIVSTQEVSDWLKDLEKNYAHVKIRVKSGEATLVPSINPFAPHARKAVEFAQAELKEDGTFEGFLPISEGETPITYTLNGETLELKPLSNAQVSEENLPYDPAKSSDLKTIVIVL